MKVKLAQKKAVFNKLHAACLEKESYALSEVCQKADISLSEIQSWTRDDATWQDALDMLKDMCVTNADLAGLLGRIPAEEALKYISANYNNSDAFKTCK